MPGTSAGRFRSSVWWWGMCRRDVREGIYYGVGNDVNRFFGNQLSAGDFMLWRARWLLVFSFFVVVDVGAVGLSVIVRGGKACEGNLVVGYARTTHTTKLPS